MLLPYYVSLEGYVVGSVLIEALKRNGPQLDTERLVETFENLRDERMAPTTTYPPPLAEPEHRRQRLKVGAVCGKAARPDLCGGAR